MPVLVERALPWLHIDHRRIYAVGGSMGGQEALLLVARYPRLLAGAIAFDAVTNLAKQYAELPELRCGELCRRAWRGPIGPALQGVMRREVGGTPFSHPRAYALRSPATFAARIAFSEVPLEMWWSVSDLVVPDQAMVQSGALFNRMLQLNPNARVEAFVGAWIHSHEQRARGRLPFALAQFGLLSRSYLQRSPGLQVRHFIPARLFARGRTPTSGRG
jgi:pimeloyl-ACP methyl ester carboxylesterase